MADDVRVDSEPSVTVRFLPTFGDLLAGTHVANAARRRVTDAILVLVTIGGFVSWGLGIASPLGGALALVATAFLILEHLPPMPAFWPLLARGPGVRPYLTDSTVVTFDAIGVHRTIGPMHRDWAWRTVTTVREDARYIHILEGSSTATRWILTIPKRSLTNPQLAELRAFLERHVIPAKSGET
jgi:hypothetical protein